MHICAIVGGGQLLTSIVGGINRSRALAVGPRDICPVQMGCIIRSTEYSIRYMGGNVNALAV